MSTALGTPPPVERLRTLKGLSGYACGHTGSCCRAGWPIPVEPAPLTVLQGAHGAGILKGLASADWLDGDVLGHTAEHHCVFHATDVPAGGCRLETALGSEAMPFSCRQFPRVLLRDARGWHLSLSAWCGTAARLIVSGGEADGASTETSHDFLSIDLVCVDPRVHVESLDARETWPPLLRPGVLGGHDAYGRWEERVLADGLRPVSRGEGTVGLALASALLWTDGLRQWRPSDGALFVRTGTPWVRRDLHWLQRWAGSQPRGPDHILLNDLITRVPQTWRPPAWPAGLTDAVLDGPPVTRSAAEAALARYLATRLMGSWVAYQGEGWRAVLASLVSAYGLAALALQREGEGLVTSGRLTSAIRAADWLLLHLLDREQWAAWCSQWEREPDSRTLLGLVADVTRVLDDLTWA